MEYFFFFKKALHLIQSTARIEKRHYETAAFTCSSFRNPRLLPYSRDHKPLFELAVNTEKSRDLTFFKNLDF